MIQPSIFHHLCAFRATLGSESIPACTGRGAGIHPAQVSGPAQDTHQPLTLTSRTSIRVSVTCFQTSLKEKSKCWQNLKITFNLLSFSHPGAQSVCQQHGPWNQRDRGNSPQTQDSHADNTYWCGEIKGSWGGWTIFSFIEMVMAGGWEDLLCACVAAPACVLVGREQDPQFEFLGLFTCRQCFDHRSENNCKCFWQNQ